MLDLINFINLNATNTLLVITGMLLTLTTGLAAYHYFSFNKGWYYLLNFLYILSFSLVISSKQWLLFLIAWELVSVTTAALLLWTDAKIASQYFVIQFIGSSCLIYVILLAVAQGYTEIGPIKENYLQILFILALGIKSAIFGLHFWLPPIHSQASPPVSAILSGWVVKLGFITYLKLISTGNTFLLYLGIAMVYYGGIKALFSTDYKVLLAYSSISQLGFIALGIGSGTTYGYLGGIFHILAHGLAKTNLFIGSAHWIKEYNSRSIYDFKNAWQRQPFTALATLLAFLSLMGFPALAGYHSKHLIKYALQDNFFLSVIIWGASILTILYVARAMRWVLFNSEAGRLQLSRSPLKKLELCSLFIPLVLLIFLGVFPAFILEIIKQDFIYQSHFWTGLRDFSLYLAIGLVLLLKLKWVKVPETVPPFLALLTPNFKKFDTAISFEGFLYKKVFFWAQKLYKLIYVEFQNQLLWIPLFFLILLFWFSLA